MNISENGEQNLRTEFKNQILEDYGTITNFSKKNGFDNSDVSKFLSNKKDWQVNKMIRMASCLKGRMCLLFIENGVLLREYRRNVNK